MLEPQVNFRPEPGSNGAWAAWLASPPGRYALQWEMAQFDRTVGDVFGFHAVQIGLPQLPGLRESRMPLRVFCALGTGAVAGNGLSAGLETQVWIDQPEALPFDTGSLDLVVLPHLLEFADDPHQVLREVDRVLRPEGRLMISGFNPVSLWGLRQSLLRGIVHDYLPRPCRLLSVPRLRDWFKLLSFEPERGRFGCYALPIDSERWLSRLDFLERAGDRWWPICGGVYFLAAVKRVQSMRMIGPAWRRRQPARAAQVVIAPPTREPLARSGAPGKRS